MGTGGSGQADAANLAKVGHVVVVMLENRSFDHMLGYLSLTGRRPEIDGLHPGLANEHQGRTYAVHHLAATALSHTLLDHTSIIKTILLRFCPQALHEPEPAKASRGSRARLGPQYPGLRVAQARPAPTSQPAARAGGLAPGVISV